MADTTARLKATASWLGDRLQERSSWIAIVTVGGTAAGHVVDPGLAEHYATVGMLVVGAVAFATKEAK